MFTFVQSNPVAAQFLSEAAKTGTRPLNPLFYYFHPAQSTPLLAISVNMSNGLTDARPLAEVDL
jgi:hypothetical protein